MQVNTIPKFKNNLTEVISEGKSASCTCRKKTPWISVYYTTVLSRTLISIRFWQFMQCEMCSETR